MSISVTELAEAIRDIRVINYPALLQDRGGPTQRTRGASEEVTDSDKQYAKALLLNIGLKKIKERKNADVRST